MKANELLIYLTRNQLKSLFEAARKLPADKLDWKPAPGARSALDQVQEVATVLDLTWSAFTERKITWSDEKFAEWLAERSKITDLDELERLAQESTEKLVKYLETVDPSEYMAEVQMPFPGDFRIADCLSYHYWNLSYHEGQINYIGSLLNS